MKLNEIRPFWTETHIVKSLRTFRFISTTLLQTQTFQLVNT